MKTIISKKGFTLIELMIVISIIGVLMAIGIATYSKFLKDGRDTRRQADLKQIQSSLERYRTDQGFYPCSEGEDCTNHWDPNSPLTNKYGLPDNPDNPLKTYLGDVPKDPLPSRGISYVYRALSGAGGQQCDNVTVMCYKYTLCAKLEGRDQELACNLEVSSPD